MPQFIKRRRSKWLAAQWQERILVNHPDHGFVDEEEIQEDAAVSMQFSNHQDRAIKHKDQILILLQQVNSKDRSSTHQWVTTISAIAAMVGDILPMNAHRLNKEITVEDVVVVETCVEDSQEDEEEEEETCSEAEAAIRQRMPP